MMTLREEEILYMLVSHLKTSIMSPFKT